MPRSVALDLIVETPLGSVGLFMLPLTTNQVTSGRTSAAPAPCRRHAACLGLRRALRGADRPDSLGDAAMARQCRRACGAKRDLAPSTTGHATTVAAVVLNLAALLGEAGRGIEDETVMFYGIGSIGLGALRLMLDVLPHPAELHLCDPFRRCSLLRGPGGDAAPRPRL